tara:strand:+ start:2133 stop:2483 length:351 start_codon:yes stop_codon:yes gene_type:complete
MIIKNKHNNENLKKKLLGGEKNIILIIIIILSIILFFIILWAMIKSMKSTPVLDITSQINFTDTIDKFLHNLSINTNIVDKVQIDKIMTLFKMDKITPSVFLLAENYYLKIPKSQI